MSKELEPFSNIDSIPLLTPSLEENPARFNETFFAAKQTGFLPVELPVVLLEDMAEQTPPPKDIVQTLIGTLHSDIYKDRIAAKHALIQMGPSVLPALEAAKKQLDPDANNNDFLKHCNDIQKAIEAIEATRKATELLTKMDPSGKLQGKEKANAIELIKALTDANLNNFQALLERLSEEAVATNIEVYKALFDHFGLKFEHIDIGNVNSADLFSRFRITSQDGKTKLEVHIAQTWNGKRLQQPTALLYLHQNRSDASASVMSFAAVAGMPTIDLPLENDADLRVLFGGKPRAEQ